jgi:hypothetical protein
MIGSDAKSAAGQGGTKSMRHRWPIMLLSLTMAGPATAVPWWYAGRAADRVVFVDAGSIERTKDIVRYSAKTVIRDRADPVAMTVAFMEADCARRRVGWAGIQRFGYDERVIDTSTRRKAEMADVPETSLADAELAFVCSDAQAREAEGLFVLAVDDAAFTEALLAAHDASPRALHDRMSADHAVPVIRSSAPDPAGFGKLQTVRAGEPMVPPRDYAKGPQVPNPTDYDPIEAGRIYDIAYQGVKDGELQFEIRGYAIDDLVHPASGQTETVRVGAKSIVIRDLAITIDSALPDRIRYKVAIEKQAPIVPDCPPGGCTEEPVAVEASHRP